MFTLIGSLPYVSVEEAMKFSNRFENNPQGIITLPELSNLGDGIIQCFDDPEKLSCLELFKQQQFSKVKIQGPGPASLIGLERFKRCSVDNLVELSANYLQTLRQGLIAEEVLVFLDEPGMQTAPPESYNLWELIFSTFSGGEKTGVHICGESGPFSDILQLKWLDWLSLDTSIVDITIFAKEYKQFRENGGSIAWGIKKESDIKDWQLGDLVTPVCGMSPQWYSTGDCERMFNLLNFTSQKLNYLNR